MTRAWDVLPLPPTWASSGCHCGGLKFLCLLAWALRPSLQLRVMVRLQRLTGTLVWICVSVQLTLPWGLVSTSPSCNRVFVSLQAHRSLLPFRIFSLCYDSKENTESVSWAVRLWQSLPFRLQCVQQGQTRALSF